MPNEVDVKPKLVSATSKYASMQVPDKKIVNKCSFLSSSLELQRVPLQDQDPGLELEGAPRCRFPRK